MHYTSRREPRASFGMCVCASVVARIRMEFKHITGMNGDWIYTDETRVWKAAAIILCCCYCGGVVIVEEDEINVRALDG